MSFNELALDPRLVAVLNQTGFQVPTQAQQNVFPAVSEGRDILLAANTGSGKTLAYLLPLLHHRLNSPSTERKCVLVVVPTRELVRQLADVLRAFQPLLKACKIVEVAGGLSINTQLLQLRGGADFLLATPGRLLDVIAHNGLETRRVEVLVLDEADRLLGEGFQEQVDEIIAHLNPRQRLMISATYTRKVRAKAGWILKSPLVVDLLQPLEKVRHRAIQVDDHRRVELLRFLFAEELATPALIFTADRKGAEQLAQQLSKASIQAAVLHGKLSTAQRASVLRKLEQNELQALVATDLAARGIDVPNLPMVINYDLPRSVELYTHRVGRTARAGLEGEALSLLDINAEAHMALIEKRLDIAVPREQLSGFEPSNTLQRPPVLTDGNGGIKGKRMSKKDKLRAAAAQAAQSHKPDTSFD